jgi:hypothetical protein
MITIFKVVRPEKDFTILPNKLLREKSLSYRARGILLMVLSHDKEWTITQSWLEQQGTEGREAIRTAVQELEAAGHVVRKMHRVAGGRIIGQLMEWHQEPVPPEERSGNAPAKGNPPSGYSPDDGNPSSGFPAPSEEQLVQKKIHTEISKTSLQLPEPSPPEKQKRRYAPPCDPPGPVELDITTPEEVKRLWKIYEEYRCGRHHIKGPMHLLWTPQAATIAAEAVNRAVLKFGEEMVCDRIRLAIEKNWQGLNLNTLGQAYQPQPQPQNGTSHKGLGARKFAALETGKVPEYQTDLTGEIR